MEAMARILVSEEIAEGGLDRLRAAGLMTDTKDYEFAYRLLANIEGRQNDAVVSLILAPVVGKSMIV